MTFAIKAEVASFLQREQMRSMTHRLFVYGTLAPGKPNEHVLRDVPGTWVDGTVKGTLVHEGWGAAAGFPGIVVDPDGDDVPGLIFTSDELVDHWDRLDRFEGADYERVLTQARDAGGSGVDVFVYQLRGRTLRR